MSPVNGNRPVTAATCGAAPCLSPSVPRLPGVAGACSTVRLPVGFAAGTEAAPAGSDAALVLPPPAAFPRLSAAPAVEPAVEAPTAGLARTPLACAAPVEFVAELPPPTWAAPVEPDAELPPPFPPIVTGAVTLVDEPCPPAVAEGATLMPLACAAPVEPEELLPPPT